jgi:hypothetical protein
LLGSASLHILANYYQPLNGALGGIATFFIIVKEFANLIFVFISSKCGLGVFRQSLCHSRQYSLRAFLKNKMSSRIGLSRFGVVAQNLTVVFIKWRMLYYC